MNWKNHDFRTQLLIAFGIPAVLFTAICIASILLAHNADTEASSMVIKGLLGALTISFFITVVSALSISERISTPIRTLADAADRVTQGDTDATVDIDREDEIGRLANAFNTMARQIQDTLADLRQKKKEAATAVEDAQQAHRVSAEQKEYLSSKVRDLLAAMDRFADGDLTVRVQADGDDEIARLFNGFNRAAANLEDMIGEVHAVAEATASAGGQISASSDQLAASVQEQSTQAEEVAAAVEEMSQTVVQNAERTQRTAEAAERGGERARRGEEIVIETVEKIEEIADAASATAATIERLGASSEEIGQIVQTIDEIADQTNLLALNAAIEAARAGEHGKGFAVVAEEVRDLAERTTEATDEIADMITSVQSETDDAIREMDRGSERVEEGLALAQEMGEAFETIVDSTDRVGERMAEIAAASEEQSTTSEQIARNVQSISSVSQESAVAVTQVADAANDLARLTTKLRRRIDQFDVEDDGTAATATGGDGLGSDTRAASLPAEPAVSPNGDGQ
jgi:methyl-accepting chemotaxis protein